MFMNSSLNWIKFKTNTFHSGRRVCELGNIAWVIFSDITQFLQRDIQSLAAFRPIACEKNTWWIINNSVYP